MREVFGRQDPLFGLLVQPQDMLPWQAYAAEYLAPSAGLGEREELFWASRFHGYYVS